MAKKDNSRHGLVDTMLSDSKWRTLIPLCCSLSMAANHSRSSPFLRHHFADSAVFAFPASWSSDDWILPDARSHFGETDVDAALFPSIKSVGMTPPPPSTEPFSASSKICSRFLRFQPRCNEKSDGWIVIALEEKREI
ncbi:uncharacterized protein LOC121981368 [Zingiber officinale]|uniref:uncharacterized protein LOC121981368 n=1 Tax=Zingiber officinale TaxID=94328 RepID=UPI001C4B02F3|nr:uncharacterized protein LOC121981368 [Zingiber officinale]